MAGRKESSGNCPTPDLLFLYSLVCNEPVNLAALLAAFFVNAAGRSSGSEIHGGEYVTVLAQDLGILRRARSTLTRVHMGTFVNMQVIKHMRIVHDARNGTCRLKGLDNAIWNPFPLLGDDDDEEDGSESEEEEPQHQPQQQYYPPPQEFYGEFTAFKNETRSNFSSMFDNFNYLFTDLHAMHPDYFGNPPPNPYQTPGDKRRRGYDGASPYGTQQDDDEED